MKKYRILALLLALVMLLSLAACGGGSAKDEDDDDRGSVSQAHKSDDKVDPAPAPTPVPTPEPTPEPKLTGVWKCEKDMLDMLTEELAEADEDSKEFLGYIDEFVFEMTLELRENGSFTLTPDVARAKESLLVAFRAYLSDLAKASGLTLSDEQLDQYSQMAADQMAMDLEPEEGSYEVDGDMLRLGDSDPMPYTLSGDSLVMTVEEFGELHFKRVG